MNRPGATRPVVVRASSCPTCGQTIAVVVPQPGPADPKLVADVEEPCRRPPTGWRCGLLADHGGPCPTRPAWWNLPAHWRHR